MRRIEMVGQTYGLLPVRELISNGKRPQCSSDCACGTKNFVTDSYSVRKALTTSCGCRQNSGESARKHGEAAKGQWTPEYRAWINMNTRCHNPNATRYKDWGGRGIIVCEEWRDDYPAFLAYVGRRPSPEHSIDRFPDPDGNYEPGNVRWATHIEQRLNQRKRNVPSSQECIHA